ncbi:hypothetical protein CS535_21225 [Yersinia massiliensis]|nr:hypothetical protein CS535_21225 [Yersinia massiliensis]
MNSTGNSMGWYVEFIADRSTAEIRSLRVTRDNAVQAIVTDAYGNWLRGQTVSFTADNGANIPASGTTDRYGSVIVSLTHTAAGTSTVTATVNGSSQMVDVTFLEPAITGVLVNGTRFAADAGSPSTGFIGAEFTLGTNGMASDYTWSSSASSWAPVDSSGKVSFTSQGNASPVTITATPTGSAADLYLHGRKLVYQ